MPRPKPPPQVPPAFSEDDRVAAEAARYFPDAYGAFVFGYKPARHHLVWYDKILDVVTGRSTKRKLLIIAPPGHAKSSVLSMVFPAWYLGRHPDHHLIFLTSNDAMSNQFATTVQMAVDENPKHQLAFPADAARPDKTRGWSLDGLYLKGTPGNVKDPAYRSVGWGSSVIGARAHGIIIDDPLTQEKATSQLEQAKAKQYYDLTINSRLVPNAWVVAIMTRWHQSDLAAHFIKRAEEEDGDWEVLNMPALAPEDNPYPWGRALWPERFPVKDLEKTRREIGGPLFQAMYQGDPTSLGGEVYRNERWFRPLPDGFDRREIDGKTPRQKLTVVQFWDLAFSAKTSANYTAAATVGIDDVGRIYLLNVWRGKIAELGDPTADKERGLAWAMANHIELTRPAVVGVEFSTFQAGATRLLIQRVNQLLLEMGVATAVRGVQVEHDKVTRAFLPASHAEAGNVFVDRSSTWWPEFLVECMGFPLMENDDQVDAFSGAVKLAIEGVTHMRRQHHDYRLKAEEDKAAQDNPLAALTSSVTLIRRDIHGRETIVEPTVPA